MVIRELIAVAQELYKKGEVYNAKKVFDEIDEATEQFNRKNDTSTALKYFIGHSFDDGVLYVKIEFFDFSDQRGWHLIGAQKLNASTMEVANDSKHNYKYDAAMYQKWLDAQYQEAKVH